MSTTQDILKDKIGKTMSVLKTELNTVRAGRANAALLDQIVVPYWGVDTPLKQLANICVADPRIVLIAPFDLQCIHEIEKAINMSSLGINPTNDGKVIRLVIPQVTEERRKELAKVIKKMGEDAKVAVRNTRRDANESLKKQEKAGELTEDDLKDELDDVQKLIDKAMKDIEDVVAQKEKELMEI